MIVRDVRIYSPYMAAVFEDNKFRLVGNKSFIVNETIAIFIECLSKPVYYDEYLAKVLSMYHHLPKDELVSLVDGFLTKMMNNGIVEYEQEKVNTINLEPKTLFDKFFFVEKVIVKKKRSIIFLAKDIRDNAEVVIKLFYLTKQDALSNGREQQLKWFESEFAKATSFGKHANLCNHLGFEESEYVYFIMEYLSNINLKTISLSSKYSFEERVAFATDIISAVAFIHKQGGLHGDLHAKNFILDKKTNKLKLIDFDFAQSPNGDHEPLVNGGVYSYLPPERAMVHKNQVFEEYEGSPTSEVYQLGTILYYLFFHNLPFKAGTWEELATKIKYEKANPVFKGEVTIKKKKIEDIILSCLEKDPLNRPFSALEVLEKWSDIC
jgi:eukaryotic-like serine/threonine-protein kinase